MPTNTTRGHELGRGKRGDTTDPGANQQAQTKATQTQAPNPQATENNKYIIKHCKNKVQLFPTTHPFKNRRFTPAERQTEKELSKIFLRPERSFFYDPPFYPWLPWEPLVNFDMGNKF